MTEWDQFIEYRCVDCLELCINRYDEDPVAVDKCHECFRLDRLELDADRPADTSERPEGCPPHMGGDRRDVSARGDRRDPPSQRDSPRSASEQERGRGSGAVATDGGEP